MSIQQEIDRIGIAKNAIRNAIEAKGVSVPSDASVDDYAEKIAEIPSIPTYQIHLASPGDYDVSVPSRAKAGTIIFTAKHKTNREHTIFQWTESNPDHMDGQQICKVRRIKDELIDYQAPVVKEAYANLPDTMVPSPMVEGYCQWFVMPPCDVYIF